MRTAARSIGIACSTVMLAAMYGWPSLGFGQSADMSAVQDRVEKMYRMYRAWGPALNYPGSSLTLKEISRNGQTFKYRLYETGLPRDQEYVLIQWPVTEAEAQPAMSGVTFDADGMAICSGRPGGCGSPDNPNEPVEMTMPAPVKGEPFRLGIGSLADPDVRAFVKIVPLSNESLDNGCHVSAVLLSLRAEVVVLEGDHFPARTPLTLVGDSEGEVRKFTDPTDAAGNYIRVILPAKAGLNGGTIRLRFQSKGCAPELTVPWGDAVN